MLHATINGVAVEAEEGATILQAAQNYGIEIPTLCYMKDLDPEGSCRICMVEVEGAPKLVTACSTPLAEGSVIHTESEKAVSYTHLDVYKRQPPRSAYPAACGGPWPAWTWICWRRSGR